MPADAGWVVLIPAYSEEKTIRTVAEGALRHVPRVQVIDDGSTDGTSAALAGLDGVELVRHEANAGKGVRLAEGLARAADAGVLGVLTIDGDGQHDVEDIPAFLAAARAHPGALVLGDRFADREAMPALRYCAIRFGDWFISWAAGRPIRDAQCGMRLYPTALTQSLAIPEPERQHFVYETAVLLHAAQAGAEIVRVPIRARYAGFRHRPSHFRPVRDLLRIAGTVSRHLLRERLNPFRGLIGGKRNR